MGHQPSSSARKRPVFIANFRASAPAAAPSSASGPEARITPMDVQDLDDREGTSGKGIGVGLRIIKSGLRHNFPAAGSVAEGGQSDGNIYRVTFAAGRMDRTYDLIRSFLREQGFSEVPLPADLEELKQFRLPPKLRHQLSLFGEDGYCHFPVKILFPKPAGRRGGLILEIHNDRASGSLLRFHRR